MTGPVAERAMPGLDEGSFLTALTTVRVEQVRSADRRDRAPPAAVWVGRTPRIDQRAPAMLALESKAVGRDSVTEVALDIDLATWLPWAERPLAPQAVLDRVALVVEDASPDSVFAVIALLARMAGLEAGTLLAGWLPAIVAWERSGRAHRPGQEWPALAAALAHAQFGRESDGTNSDYARAWTDMLRFAGECLRRKLDPLAIPENEDFPLLREARARLDQDAQAYRDLLAHAHTLQLSLPLRATPGRRLLIDALLFTEDDPAGAAKTIFRNDTENSPLQRGFTLSAIHRPGAAPGDDITISLDDRRGVGLREIWQELERRETERWNGARPCEAPRDAARLGPANQPWWLTPDETLIAAPRAVVVDDVTVAGSKLSWEEVCAAIWSVGNPLRGITVARLDGQGVPLDAIPSVAGAGKIVRLARWQTAPGSPRALPRAPVIDRILAALTRSVPKLDDFAMLPLPGAWSRVELAGGFAVISADGVFVLDDWQGAAHPDLASLSAICQSAASFDAALGRLDAEVEAFSAAFARSIEGKRRLSEPLGLGARATGIAVRLASLRGTRLHPATEDAARLQAGLDRVWALDMRLSAMEAQVRAISDSMRALGDANMRWWTQAVALIAFPFYLATGLAKPLASGALLLGERAGWGTAPLGEPPLLAWSIAASSVFVLTLLVAAWFIRRNATRAAAAITSGGTRAR